MNNVRRSIEQFNIKSVIESFPEPFKSVISKGYKINFDYHLHEGKNDHEWLKQHGYTLKMCQDCSFFVEGLPNLSATSYGDWGSIYDDMGEYSKEERIDGYNKSFNEFCKMYEEGIVKLWRISLHINGCWYMYDDNKKEWTVNRYDGHHWEKCNNPLVKKNLTLLELRNKIDDIIKNTPSWDDVPRIGIVTAEYEDGFKDMEWLIDIKPISCDGHGMVAFQLVLEDDDYAHN